MPRYQRYQRTSISVVFFGLLISGGCGSAPAGKTTEKARPELQPVLSVTPTADGNAYIRRFDEAEADGVVRVQFVQNAEIIEIAGTFEMATITPLSDGSAILEDAGRLWRLRKGTLTEISKGNQANVLPSGTAPRNDSGFWFALVGKQEKEIADLKEEIRRLEVDEEDYD